MAGTVGSVNHSANTLNRIGNEMAKTTRILSTGSNYPGASYGGSAYAISQGLNSYTGSTEQSIQNTQNAGAMLKTAAGATSNTIDALKSIRKYLVNAANGINTDSDRAALQENVNQLVKQIDDNSRVKYNGMSLLDGSRSSVMIYGVSGYENVSMGNMSAQALGLADGQGNSTLDLTNDDAIQESLKAVGGALEFVEDVNDNLQATLSGGDILSYSLEEAVNEGVYLNGLEYREANYTTMAENTQAAESTINDADMAKHSVNLNLQKIQQQVAVEVSKIFKHSQSSVLELLR